MISIKVMNFLSYRSNQIILLISVLIMFLLSIYHIFIPFNDDQAFYNLGGKAISQGAILYKDFWDIKQPGIYIFYYIGGSIFSFTEHGIHLFELFYWLIFSLILVRLSLSINLFKTKIFHYLLPIFTVGIYLAITDSLGRTQNEILASAPLILIILIFYKYGKSGQIIPYFISGILMSIVLFYKLPFLIIIGSIVLFHIIVLIKNKISISQIFLRKVLPALIGFLILPLIFIIFSFEHGIEKIVFDTFFLLPLRMKSEHAIVGSVKFSEMFADYINRSFPLGLFSFILIIKGLKKKSELVYLLIILFFSSLLVIYLHIFRWTYYYLILLFPLGILSLLFLDRIDDYNSNKKNHTVFFVSLFLISVLYFLTDSFTKWSKGFIIFPLGTFLFFLLYNQKLTSIKYLKLIIIILLFGVPIIRFFMKTKTFFENYSLEQGISKNYKYKYHSDYSNVENESFVIMRDFNDYNILVFGDPLIFYFTDRMPANPTACCYVVDFFIDEQWLALKREIVKYKPKYIYIRDYNIKSLNKQGLMALINTNYKVLNINKRGIWYIINKNE